MTTLSCAVCRKQIGQEQGTVHSHSDEAMTSIRVHRIHNTNDHRIHNTKEQSCHQKWMSALIENSGKCHLCPDKAAVEILNNNSRMIFFKPANESEKTNPHDSE